MKNVSNSMNLGALADTYLRYHKEQRTEDSWAMDRVSEILRDEPDVALELTLLLLKKAERMMPCWLILQQAHWKTS